MTGILEHLTRPVKVATWKWYALHAATASLVLDALLSLHYSWFVATLAAALSWLPIEVIQWIVHRRIDLDALADAVTYQPVWIAYAAHEHGVLGAIGAAAVWAVAFLSTVRWARP